MSSISLPAALWLIAGAASAVWLAAGWRWLTRLLHILQGGGYYQRYFLRWLLQAGRHHQIIFTAALLLPLLTAGLQAAPWPAWLPLLVLVAWGLVGLHRLLRFRPPLAKQPAALDDEGAGAGDAGLVSRSCWWQWCSRLSASRLAA